jgi:hypothetical protein
MAVPRRGEGDGVGGRNRFTGARLSMNDCPMRAGPSEIGGVRAFSWPAIAIFAAALGGCGASVDMASGGSAARATMTVPYTNVREEVRLYPDYGPIGASILVADGAAKDDKRPASSKKGKP